MKILFAIAIASLVFSVAAVADPGHWQGKQRAVVLLLEWKNQPAKHSAAEVNEVFFGEGKSSVRDFLKENSAGTADLTGDVRNWLRTEQTWNGSASCDLDQIVNEAWQKFSRSINIADYDSDHDGKIDNLFIVHSGRISSDRVGPDCAFTESSLANHTIVFQSEGLGSIGQQIPIGFYLHEAGHAYFGFPDLYADHYHGHYGIGMWGMMGLGAWGTDNRIRREDMFRYPSHFEPYSKVQIGWITPHVVNKTTQHVSVRAVETSGDIVAIPVGSNTSYYLEYRSAQGFSRDHRGHGLLIWKNYELIQADGRNDLDHGNNLGHRPVPPNDENFGDDSDPFPGSGNVTFYEDRDAHVRIENIAQYADRVEFDVRMLDGFKTRQWKRPHHAPLDFQGLDFSQRPTDF